MLLSKHRVTYSIIIALLIIIFAAIAIFWARGFKPNFRNGSIDRTGLIVASSIPTGASVYLDDRLTSATDTNITFLDPKTYKVKISKDGYSTWQKEVEVRADLATEIKALLFPLAPEIKPLTTTGAASPTVSPDNLKIVYGVSGQNGGAYLLFMQDRSFLFHQEVRLLAKNRPGFDFSKATFIWNPNSKELIARTSGQDDKVVANILIDSDKTEQEFKDITGSLTNTLDSYQQDYIQRAQTLALTVPAEVKEATMGAEQVKVESQSRKSTKPSPSPKLNSSLSTSTLTPHPNPTGMIFSPDEEKILYKDKTGKNVVYDLKEKKQYTLPDFSDLFTISWYPDSQHLLIVQKDQIAIIEKDGTNKMVVFSGKFENAQPGGGVFTHPSGQRLIILTTLTQSDGTPTNLYSINLR